MWDPDTPFLQPAPNFSAFVYNALLRAGIDAVLSHEELARQRRLYGSTFILPYAHMQHAALRHVFPEQPYDKVRAIVEACDWCYTCFEAATLALQSLQGIAETTSTAMRSHNVPGHMELQSACERAAEQARANADALRERPTVLDSDIIGTGAAQDNAALFERFAAAISRLHSRVNETERIANTIVTSVVLAENAVPARIRGLFSSSARQASRDHLAIVRHAEDIDDGSQRAQDYANAPDGHRHGQGIFFPMMPKNRGTSGPIAGVPYFWRDDGREVPQERLMPQTFHLMNDEARRVVLTFLLCVRRILGYPLPIELTLMILAYLPVRMYRS